MIHVLDQGVGAVVRALRKAKMLSNTVIVFQSDNGGPVAGLHSTDSSNWPLRGVNSTKRFNFCLLNFSQQKISVWEGASRVNSIFYAPFLKEKGVVREQFMDVSDWLPTLGGLAGVDFSNESLDGIDQWEMINEGGSSLRSEIVNIDNVYNYSAIIRGDYKWVTGTISPSTDGWISDRSSLQVPFLYPFEVATSTTNFALASLTSTPLTIPRIRQLQNSVQIPCKGSGTSCLPQNGPCLFNIIEDPCEEDNLAAVLPETLSDMTDFYQFWLDKTVPSNRKPADNASDPINFGGVWQWWQPDSAF